MNENVNFDKLGGLFKDYPVDFVYIYGSFADGTNRPWSDIDIAIIAPSPLSQKEADALELEISKKIDKNIKGAESDVRIFNNAPLNYKIQVVQTGKLIYSKNESKRVDFETKVRSEYFDFLPKKNEYRNAFLGGIKKGGLLWSTKKK